MFLSKKSDVSVFRKRCKNECKEVIGQNKNDPVGQDFTGGKNKGVIVALSSGDKLAWCFHMPIKTFLSSANQGTLYDTGTLVSRYVFINISS